MLGLLYHLKVIKTSLFTAAGLRKLTDIYSPIWKVHHVLKLLIVDSTFVSILLQIVRPSAVDGVTKHRDDFGLGVHTVQVFRC